MQTVYDDFERFIKTHPIEKLYGFDIGGGTPTALSDESFVKLMDFYTYIINRYEVVSDFASSIESTFGSISNFKLEALYKAGFRRISFDLQHINRAFLDNNERDSNLSKITEIMNKVKSYGDLKSNIDLMYGFDNQSLEEILNTVEAIEKLSQNQVTLYEMRYNMVGGESHLTKDFIAKQYDLFYKKLMEIGYHATYGMNTFTKDPKDRGLSSYLKYRMFHFVPYKGFGISAQSASFKGVSYNKGKQGMSLDECLELDSYKYQDVYLLPKEELLGKYIAISLYSGSFNLKIMESIIGEDPLVYFKKFFDELLEKQLIYIDEDIVHLTSEGFTYYGAIGALFYPERQQQY